MRDRRYYTIEAAAWGTILLLAVAMIWLSLTAPEREDTHLLLGILWLLAASLGVVEGMRGKPLIGTSLDTGKFMWSMPIGGLILLAVVLLRGVPVEIVELLHSLVLLLLGAWLLYAYAAIRRGSRSVSSS